MAVFVQKDCVIEELYSKVRPWFLKEAEITSIENLYVNDRNPISTRITRHHTFNKRSKPFQRCYYESVYTKPSKNVNGVISTTSYLIPSIAQGHFNYEYQTIVAE